MQRPQTENQILETELKVEFDAREANQMKFVSSESLDKASLARSDLDKENVSGNFCKNTLQDKAFKKKVVTRLEKICEVENRPKVIISAAPASSQISPKIVRIPAPILHERR